MSAEIREVNTEYDEAGRITRVRIVFGPHHFFDLEANDGRVTAYIGATHHGIRADASEVNSELERFVNELQRSHPDNSF